MELLTDKKPKWLNNYGFIEESYEQDGDELDCFVLGKPLDAGKIVDVKPVAMIEFKDGEARDDKVIAIQGEKISKIHLAFEILKLIIVMKLTKNKGKILGVVTSKKAIKSKIYRSQSLYRILIKEAANV